MSASCVPESPPCTITTAPVEVIAVFARGRSGVADLGPGGAVPLPGVVDELVRTIRQLGEAAEQDRPLSVTAVRQTVRAALRRTGVLDLCPRGPSHSQVSRAH